MQVFSSSFLTSACIIAAVVFVLSDHSNVSLVNTFFSIFYFFVFFAFCFISVLYFSMPLPLKEKKKKKLSFTVVTGWSLCVDCFVPVACENVDFIVSFLKPAVPVVVLLTERLP